jgi:3-methyladenine DNA glycosylase AlkD
MVSYLEKYIEIIENWAHVDILGFHIHDNNFQQFLNLSIKYQYDSRTFVRRLGLMILFQMVKDEEHLSHIFDVMIRLKSENVYYVIMMAGWLLCECIILHEGKTLNFLKSNFELSELLPLLIKFIKWWE